MQAGIYAAHSPQIPAQHGHFPKKRCIVGQSWLWLACCCAPVAKGLAAQPTREVRVRSREPKLGGAKHIFEHCVHSEAAVKCDCPWQKHTRHPMYIAACKASQPAAPALWCMHSQPPRLPPRPHRWLCENWVLPPPANQATRPGKLLQKQALHIISVLLNVVSPPRAPNTRLRCALPGCQVLCVHCGCAMAHVCVRQGAAAGQRAAAWWRSQLCT